MAEKTFVSINNELDNELKEPSLFNVLLHNDNYTSMDFVVDVLVSIFKKSNVEAAKVMLEVHHKGAGIAGVFPYDIGISKIQEVKRRAKEKDFPLLCTLEKV